MYRDNWVKKDTVHISLINLKTIDSSNQHKKPGQLRFGYRFFFPTGSNLETDIHKTGWNNDMTAFTRVKCSTGLRKLQAHYQHLFSFVSLFQYPSTTFQISSIRDRETTIRCRFLQKSYNHHHASRITGIIPGRETAAQGWQECRDAP
jgi:hypothetical protein